MGTRGLTVVIMDGKHRIAQYGQWDHYPTGQGATAMQFCRKHLSTEEGREKFRKAVNRTEFADQERLDKLLKRIGISGEWMSMEQAERFKTKYPALSRDAGAKVLDLVLGGKKLLRDSIDFAAESLFCEWAYVIDLDACKLEVYEGFQKAPHKRGRFADMDVSEKPVVGDKYYPVALIASFDFDKIPKTEGAVEEVMKRLEKLTNGPNEDDPKDTTPDIDGLSPVVVAKMAIADVLPNYHDRGVSSIDEAASRYDCPDEPDTVVKDILADLRHYCDEHDLDFAELDKKAYAYYLDEVHEDSLEGTDVRRVMLPDDVA
jgi:hypothetical protein